MLQWLKDLVRPIRTRDPRFGDLLYLRDARFWEGKVTFAPVGRLVEVIVCGSETGPTAAQRSFIDELELRYDALWPMVHEKLLAERRKMNGASDVAFDLVCVNVPETPCSSAEWELSYETRPAAWH